MSQSARLRDQLERAAGNTSPLLAARLRDLLEGHLTQAAAVHGCLRDRFSSLNPDDLIPCLPDLWRYAFLESCAGLILSIRRFAAECMAPRTEDLFVYLRERCKWGWSLDMICED